MKLTFIRHTAPDVPKGVCYGQTDVPLASTFEDEARAVAEKLSGYRFDAVFCSPLSRCVRLAEYCGHGDAVRDDRLKEMNFGAWEMKRWEEIDDPRLQEWYDDYFNVRVTDGESFNDLGERFASFIDDIKGRGYESVAIFAHGGILMHALMRLCGVSGENIFSHQPAYGGIIEAEV